MLRQCAILVLLAMGLVGDASAHGILGRMLSLRRQCREQAPPARTEGPRLVTLEGRVTFVGTSPAPVSLEKKIYYHPDGKFALQAPKEELLDPTWRIDPKTRGVANVCVYLKRPKDGRLPILEEDKTRRDTVVMDAPFTFFRPHMVAHYPEWNDGVDQGKTGQKVIVKNSSIVPMAPRAITHPKYNPPYGMSLPPGPEVEFKFRPQPLPVIIQCDVHTWSQAYVWVFDHPYFAITRTDGTFTIPRVPAGMEVQVMAWHESQGWLFTRDGETMTLKPGRNVLDFEIGAK